MNILTLIFVSLQICDKSHCRSARVRDAVIASCVSASWCTTEFSMVYFICSASHTCHEPYTHLTRHPHGWIGVPAPSPYWLTDEYITTAARKRTCIKFVSEHFRNYATVDLRISASILAWHPTEGSQTRWGTFSNAHLCPEGYKAKTMMAIVY